MSEQNQEEETALAETLYRLQLAGCRIASLDDIIRCARWRGLKPEYEWRREDFQDLLDAYPELRELAVSELRALFLHPEDKISDVVYYKRFNMENVQYFHHHDRFLCFPLAIPEKLLRMKKRADKLPNHLRTKDEQEALQWVDDEKTKLARIWQNLGGKRNE